MAVVEMAANPFGAHQVSRHMVGCGAVHLVAVLDNAGRVAALNLGPVHLPMTRPAKP